jgi:hypothetical protein
VKKLVYLLVLLILPCLIIGGIVSASDTSGAQYYGVVTVTNNSTATTVVSTNISGLNSTEMMAQGWLNSSANNCAIQYSGGDIPFMPGNGTSPWTMFVNSIGANSQLSYTFFTDDVTGGKIAYFPGSTGMAVTEALEPSANFSISMTGYLDTTKVGSNLFNKPSAILCNVSGSGNITATIYDTQHSPSSTTDTTAAWSNDASSIDNNLATYAETTAAVGVGAWSAYLEFPHAAINTGGITYRCSLADNTVSEINLDAYYGGGWNDVYSGTFNVSAIETKYLSPIQSCTNLRISIKNTDVNPKSAGIFEVYYLPIVSVTATGISSGEKNVNVYADSSNLTISVDGVIKNSIALGGLSVTNNANNWAIGDDDATPYITSVNITVGGNLKGSWKWNYGATFPDDSGNGNTATPSFRTTSSDADVSATLISFSPVTEPTAPAFVVGSGPAWFSTNITISGNYTSGNTTTLNYPGRAFIESLASATVTPAQLPVVIISGFLILAVSITASAFLRLHGSGTLFVKICVLAVGFGCAVGLRIYDFWMLIFLGIFALFVLLGSKERTS